MYKLMNNSIISALNGMHNETINEVLYPYTKTTTLISPNKSLTEHDSLSIKIALTTVYITVFLVGRSTFVSQLDP